MTKIDDGTARAVASADVAISTARSARPLLAVVAAAALLAACQTVSDVPVKSGSCASAYNLCDTGR